MTRYTLIAMLAGSLSVASLPASAQSSTGGPTYSLTPYLWLPNINGTLKYNLPSNIGGATSSDVEAGPNSYLSNLKFAIMIAGEVRYDDWFGITDLIRLDFSADKSKVKSAEFGSRRISIDASANAQTQTSLSGTVWTLAVGHSLIKKEQASLDAFVGFRYANISASTDWQLSTAIAGPGPGQAFAASGNVSDSVNLWDGIIGLRGRVKLGDRWSMPYYVDVGTGSSDVTWQAVVGVNYAFNWGELGLVYRHLAYDQGADKFLQDFSFSGPALSATFRF